MNAFVTKDPSKGFGAGTLFTPAPDTDLMMKERKEKNSMAPTSASMKKGGKVSSASSRADGIATKGKTRGTMITIKGGGYAC